MYIGVGGKKWCSSYVCPRVNCEIWTIYRVIFLGNKSAGWDTPLSLLTPNLIQPKRTRYPYTVQCKSFTGIVPKKERRAEIAVLYECLFLPEVTDKCLIYG